MSPIRSRRGPVDFPPHAHAREDSNNATPDSGMTPNSTGDASHFNDEGHASDNDGENSMEGSESKGRRASKSSSSSKQDSQPKEKRKRSRVTSEQLRHLERIFQTERAPIAPRRKEISDLLGMNERQTQIWFQNRRAKEKTLRQREAEARRESEPVPTESVPGIPSAPDVDVYQLIHENEPVTLVPCTDLTIGTWRRISTAPGKKDLLAYICESRKCISWYIQSEGHAFKMDMPFRTVTKTDLTRIGAGTAVMTLTVSKTPTFALEKVASTVDKKNTTRSWEACSDWTENRQASNCFTHRVQGSFTELNYAVESIEKHNGRQGLALPRKSIYDDNSLPPLTMEIPAPPMASLAPPSPYDLTSLSSRHSQSPLDPRSKRLSYDSSQAPSPSSYSLDTSLNIHAPPHSAPTSSYSQGPGFLSSHRQHIPQSHFSQSGLFNTQDSNTMSNTFNGRHQDAFNQYGGYLEPRLSSSNTSHSLHNPHGHLNLNHNASHTHTHTHISQTISRSHTASPYSALSHSGAPGAYAAGNPRALPSYTNNHHREPAPASTPARLSPLSLYPTPSHSPPLLTTPYGSDSCAARDSAGHFHGLGASVGVHGASGPSVRAPSGMPGLMYETDEGLHLRRPN